MNLSKKVVRQISLIYAGISVLINFIGALLPLSVGTPTIDTVTMNTWIGFLENHSFLTNILTAVTFLIPLTFCFFYSILGEIKNYKERFINLPLVYSCIGILGWIVYFLFEIIVLRVAKKLLGISVSLILLTSLNFIILEALFTFTLSYFILYTLHRKFFLPKYFPEGNLSKYSSLKPSIPFLFFVFYISICLFPVIFLVSSHISIVKNNGLALDGNTFLVLAIIMTMGILLLVTVSRSFSSPLKKLIEGTEKVKNGNLDDKVEIVSNDDFGKLADTFNDMTTSLSQKTQKIIAIQDSVIKGMAVMVESRDNSTGGHINRTSDCVKVFATRLQKEEKFKNIPESFFEKVVKAAPMHDLGKIAVDDSILRKPGKFTDEEYNKMKEHSAAGAEIVRRVLSEVDDEEFKKIAENVAHFHHEKWDGSGYPTKISGEQIPLEARIMALADVFDALVSKRCYKESFTYDRAFNIIKESTGSHFDPMLGEIFIGCRADLETLYKGYGV